MAIPDTLFLVGEILITTVWARLINTLNPVVKEVLWRV